MQETRRKKILIVDDNQSIRLTVSEHLIAKGYDVAEAVDGIQGMERGLSGAFDVMILDVVMPGIDGFKLCHLLRENRVETPIILLTERASIDDKVTGFSQGADDYLAKPFDPVELEMRIQALLRRSPQNAREIEKKSIKHDDLEIDLDRHLVTIGGKEVSLTPIEFNILRLLASNPGHVYSRQDLLTVVWGTDYDGYKRNIDPHVNRLRTKVETNPKQPKFVLTVWGIGYKFNDSLSRDQESS
jgi:DNA-binding response OmpR family regulator